MAAVLSGTLLKSSKNHGLARPFVAAKFSTTEQKCTTAEHPKNPLFNPNLAQLKRGTGGRSSFNGIVATVFGASGYMGPIVCNKLGKSGTQIIIPYRGTAYDVRPLKLVGDLGQVLFVSYNLKDEASIKKALYRSNLVINLVGREWETAHFPFKEVHVNGARRIARLARECGVKRLIHFSALNSCEHPKPIILKKGSGFYASKYQGELAVREEFPEATILRPSDIWGEYDNYLLYFADKWRRTLSKVAVWEKGLITEKQPVFSSDVAQAVINCMRDPDTAGKSYDIVGPHRYMLSELVDYIFRVLRRGPEYEKYERTNMKYDPLFLLRVAYCDMWTKISKKPKLYISWERMEREATTDTLLGNPTLVDLGITPTSLESRIEFEIKHLRNFNYYMEELGEFPPAALPKLVEPIDETA